MDRRHLVVVAVVGIAGWLACCPASADPRTPPRVEDVAIPDAEPAAWLSRLVGRFSFEGALSVNQLGGCEVGQAEDGGAVAPPKYCQSVKGLGDCVAIGSGPGVQCVLNVTWTDLYQEVHPPDDHPGIFEIPGGVSYLDPAMLLFGIDPGKSAISMLLVDSKGLPEGGIGGTRGNRATFKTTCVNAASLFNAMYPGIHRTCERVVRIDAKPDAKTLFMMIDLNIDDGDVPFTSFSFTLRRMAQEEPGKVSTALPARR